MFNNLIYARDKVGGKLEKDHDILIYMKPRSDCMNKQKNNFRCRTPLYLSAHRVRIVDFWFIFGVQTSHVPGVITGYWVLSAGKVRYTLPCTVYSQFQINPFI